MARGCGKAQRGVTRGRFVGSNQGPVKMSIGGVPGNERDVGGYGGFGGGSSVSGSASRDTGQNFGSASSSKDIGQGNDRGGAGSASSMGSPASRAAASAAARSPISESVRLGDLPAQSMAGAGVNPYVARAASNEIMGRVSRAALDDMGRGNIDTSKFGPRASGGNINIGGFAVDPTIQASSIPSVNDVFTDERIPESLPDVATSGIFDMPGFNLGANFGLPSFFNKIPKQFTQQVPSTDADAAHRMNLNFNEVMGLPSKLNASQAKQQQKLITDSLPQEEVLASQRFTPVAKDFSKRMEGLSITPTVSSPSSPSIGSVKSADYQQIADATAARLKSQGVKATPEQINQLAFGSAYMTPAVKAGSQIQKLNTLQQLIAKGSKKTGKFDAKTLSPEDLTKYKNLSAEAKELIDSQEVIMYSPGTSLYGIKQVPKSTGLVVDPKTGYLTSPSYSKVLGPTNIPTSIGVYENTTFYAPNTPEYAKAVPSKILGRDMPGALADYSQYRSQSVPDAVPSSPLVSGTPNGYTPVPKDFSGRMEGLNFAAPAQQVDDSIQQVPPTITSAPDKKTPITTIPPGAISYKGNWSGSPSYIFPNRNIERGGGRDRTSRDGRSTEKVNPFEPGTRKYLRWEERYGAAQNGDVSSSSDIADTGTMASTAKNGGFVRGYGKAVRGRKGVRFI